jgi:hypothetical protein
LIEDTTSFQEEPMLETDTELLEAAVLVVELPLQLMSL